MRSRNIKPNFFKNEILAELKPLTRLLFIGLWCLADKRGRLENRPKRIKVEILPFDNGDITVMLQELNDHGFICFYGGQEKPFIQIPNFEKHQHPHHTEKDSELPEYQQDSNSTGYLTVTEPFVNRETPSDSLNRNHERGIDAAFDAFWKAYPRKEAKQNALKAWKKICISKQLLDVIMAGLSAWKATKQWQEGIIPHPATWLNQKRWEDEIGGKIEEVGVLT